MSIRHRFSRWLLPGLGFILLAEVGWWLGQEGRLADAYAHAQQVHQTPDPSGGRRGISWISPEMDAERAPLKAVARGEAEWLEAFFRDHHVPEEQVKQVREILYLHAKRLTSLRSRIRWAGFLEDEARDLLEAERYRRTWLLHALLGPDDGAILDSMVQARWGYLLELPAADGGAKPADAPATEATPRPLPSGP